MVVSKRRKKHGHIHFMLAAHHRLNHPPSAPVAGAGQRVVAPPRLSPAQLELVA